MWKPRANETSVFRCIGRSTSASISTVRTLPPCSVSSPRMPCMKRPPTAHLGLVVFGMNPLPSSKTLHRVGKRRLGMCCIVGRLTIWSAPSLAPQLADALGDGWIAAQVLGGLADVVTSGREPVVLHHGVLNVPGFGNVLGGDAAVLEVLRQFFLSLLSGIEEGPEEFLVGGVEPFLSARGWHSANLVPLA